VVVSSWRPGRIDLFGQLNNSIKHTSYDGGWVRMPGATNFTASKIALHVGSEDTLRPSADSPPDSGESLASASRALITVRIGCVTRFGRVWCWDSGESGDLGINRELAMGGGSNRNEERPIAGRRSSLSSMPLSMGPLPSPRKRLRATFFFLRVEAYGNADSPCCEQLAKLGSLKRLSGPAEVWNRGPNGSRVLMHHRVVEQQRF
jgi:hypothetical protein